MTRLFPAALAILAASGAAAQHHHAAHPAGHGDSLAVAEAFVVTGLRVDEAAPPAGSAVGRAGLRYKDGGYVAVTYGRPYARGRQLWGGLVAEGEVWVAGAHRATELATTVPLVVGGARVEPGVYALFVTPRAGRWTLHVNARPGQHLADEYDAAEDVAVADAAPMATAAPAEGLTWQFSADGGALTLAWGDRQAAFPLARADR